MLRRVGRSMVLGLVVVLVAGLPTTAGSAADGAVDVDAQLSDFSVLGVEGVYLKKNATVVSGDVGVMQVSAGPFLAGSQELTVGIGVSLTDGTSRVIGDSVKVKSGAVVGDVYANDVTGDGTVSGSVTSPIHLPLDVTLPSVPTVSPGATDFDVPQNGSLSLDAGAYGLLKVRKGASVTLTGGVYEFAEWDLGDNVTLVASTPVEVRIAGRVATGKSSSIGPAAGAGLDATDVQITVLGINGGAGNVGATPKAAKFGLSSSVTGTVWVPNGTLYVRQNATVLGRFVGRWVTVGIGASVERQVVASSDTSPPVVALASPSDSDVVFASELLVASASDDVGVTAAEFLIDGTVAGSVSDPDPDGLYRVSWDTTAVADGDHAVSVRAVDAAGNTTSTGPVTVSVANGLSVSQRVVEDYERAVISVDEYVEWGIWSLTNPALLDDRYAAGGDDATTDATPDGLAFLASWDELDPSTQQRLRDFVTVQEVEITQQAQGAAARTQAAGAWGPWPECGDVAGTLVVRVLFAKAFRCVHPVDAGQGNRLFDVFYTVEGLDDPSILAEIWVAVSPDVAWAETVGDTDVSGSFGVPDDIETISTSLLESYAVYGDAGLGYSLPSAPARVAVHNTRGMVIPDLSLLGGVSPVVQLDNNSDLNYLPRHELFHAFQFEYFGLDDLTSGDLQGLLWWMEATAEWGAHQVVESLTSPTEADRYDRRLDEFLLEPWRRVDTFQGNEPKRQYGAFILAEYFEQRFGAQAIRETWEQLMTSNVIDDIGIVLGSQVPSTAWEQELPTFWKAAYLLSSAQGDGPFIDDAADVTWRVPLQTKPELDGDTGWWAEQLGLEKPRLRRDHRLLVGDVKAASTVTIEGGGARFVELVPANPAPLQLPAPDGVIQIDVSGSQGLSVQLIAFEKYPEAICEAFPISLDTSPIGVAGSVAVAADSACPFTTLIATNPDPQGNTIDFTWEATLQTTPNLLTNPGFETGNTIGWGWFDESDPGYGCFSGGVGSVGARTETYHTLFDISEGCDDAGPGGWQQTVTVTTGESYTASIWFKLPYGGGFDNVGSLQILQPDGTVIAEQSVFGDWDDRWQRFTVPFAAPSDTVVFRFGFERDPGDRSRAWFDDAQLLPRDLSILDNRDFDDGIDGWALTGTGAITEDLVEGRTVLQITPGGSSTGVEQWFDAYNWTGMRATVKVTAGTADITLTAVRLDGTVVDTITVTVDADEGWRNIGEPFWNLDTEDHLLYRFTTTGPSTVLFDTAHLEQYD